VDARALTLLTVDPFNASLAGDLGFVLEREILLTVADPEAVSALIRQHFGEEDGSLAELARELGSAVAPAGVDDAATETDLEQLAGQTPIIRFVSLVLTQAIRDRALDIHFEPFEHEFKIRCRVDGALRELTPPPRQLARPIVSRLKVLAHLNIAERRLPQDGRIKLTVSGRTVDLRVSTLPTQFGESVVLRVLDQSVLSLELTQLGLPAPVDAGVRAAISRPNGMFIVTGPTGSGKTTTLYSCLHALHSPGVKILTVEDPVEYEIDGIMQVPVNQAAGLTFARALRSFLRQDPDIVMVGEMRDLETAQIAVHASLTGHLVLSTLHTNDAPGAVTRLLDLGIEPFLLASTLEGVLAQRLLRRICPECKTARTPAESVRRHLGADFSQLGEQTCYVGLGCPACQYTGYRGRLGIFELLPINDELRDLIVDGASLMQLRQKATALGLTSLRDAGVRAVLEGETTLEEVMRYT
jgi:type IV pilus assembly protein PilB